jgi:hypothetical protein
VRPAGPTSCPTFEDAKRVILLADGEDLTSPQWICVFKAYFWGQFCSLVLIAALIALPSTAKAWHYSLNGWDFDSYAECMDYHTKNPPTAGCSINPTICHPAYTPVHVRF